MITYKHHIFTQGSDIYMVTLDIDALLTNIQLDKTIDICVNKFFKNPEEPWLKKYLKMIFLIY